MPDADARVLTTQISITADSLGEDDELSTDSVTDLRILGQQAIDRISHGKERLSLYLTEDEYASNWHE